MEEGNKKERIIIIGAGPVGALAALYAALRDYEVEIYELRSGMPRLFPCFEFLPRCSVFR